MTLQQLTSLINIVPDIKDNWKDQPLTFHATFTTLTTFENLQTEDHPGLEYGDCIEVEIVDRPRKLVKVKHKQDERMGFLSEMGSSPIYRIGWNY